MCDDAAFSHLGVFQVYKAAVLCRKYVKSTEDPLESHSQPHRNVLNFSHSAPRTGLYSTPTEICTPFMFCRASVPVNYIHILHSYSLATGQSYNCHSASEATLEDIGQSTS